MTEPRPVTVEAHGGETGLQRRHLLTVCVEEYFQVGALKDRVRVKHWDRIESRLEQSLADLLELFAQNDATATFFVLGWIAERKPHVVRSIVERGHEVASAGYWPYSSSTMTPDEFRKDLVRSLEILESSGAHRIVGYRSPWLTEDHLWTLDILAEEGIAYDSSINPILRRFAGDPRRFDVHEHVHSSDESLRIRCLPISTRSLLGLRIAISGGNYIRQFPHWLLSRAVARWDREKDTPVNFYFRPWEVDKEQPRIHSLRPLKRLRHYRNLAKTREILEGYLSQYRFQAIDEYLGIPRAPAPLRERRESAPIEIASEEGEGDPDRVPVTVVVPLFNEEPNVAYVARTLRSLRASLSRTYDIRLHLVDDGSDDETWSALQEHFGDVPWCEISRLPENRGVAEAILEGIRRSQTEFVCSIDADCSYDPYVLENMIPQLAEADLVTASPYHPNGRVANVPGWRLFLSKNLSRLYSLLLRQRLYTFTSCCRAYRKSAVSEVHVEHGGFLGVAELLIRLRQGGGRVIEHPAVLESRLFGASKMKTFRTVWKHLGLLASLALRRPRRSRPAKAAKGEKLLSP